MSDSVKTWIFIAIVALLVLLLAASWEREPELTPYSRLLTHLEVAQVESVDATLTGPGNAARFHVHLVGGESFDTVGPLGDELLRRLAAGGVPIEVHAPVETPWWRSPAFLIAVVLLLVFLWLVLRKATGGNVWQEMKSAPGRLLEEAELTGCFADVVGCEAAKTALRELVAGLRAEAPGAGRVLLTGPPGNGKTHLARALAGEAGIPFRSVTATAFVEMFVGVGAARVRALFEVLGKAAPCIVFLDEFDAIAKRRQPGHRGHEGEEREQALSELLAALDGFEAQPPGVALVAATNRVDLLDEAILRPGRFDRVVEVPPPDAASRLALFKRCIGEHPVDPALDIDGFVEETAGLSCAALVALVEAARGRAGHEVVGDASLREARADVMAGRVPVTKSEALGGDPDGG